MKTKYNILGRYLTLVGHLGLIATILLWNTVIAPSKEIPVAMILIILLVPLLLPLLGILNGKVYSHGWTIFLSLFYFTIGVSDAYSDPTDRLFGILTIILSLCLFLGSIIYIRTSSIPAIKTE